jgi:acyl-CoA synthetase (AMP-forming)/AMP-acid ligase II
VLAHCDARILLCSRDLVEALPRALETRAEIVDIAELPSRGAFEPTSRIGSDIAQIIYTSGSTGLPKGVTITHANLWAGARAVSDYVGITAADRIASLLPFSFDYGFNQLLCATLNGAILIVERSPIPQQIALTLRERGVTVLPCVPPLWLQLLSAPEFYALPLPELRAMTNTGGRLPVDAVRRLRQVQPQAKLFLMYGLTEAFRATYLDPCEVDSHPDSIGRAIPGSEIMVLREDGTECALGEEGELVQRGPTVAAGYWNDPEATARVFRANPRRPEGGPDSERVVFSGDIVRRDMDGRLYFVGRRDRIIKTLGFRVSPDEVCEVLYASGEVSEALVGSEPDEQRGERIVAYVVLKTEGDAGRLQRFCRTELPRYMQPARIETLSTLPRTSSGKFDLRATQERAADRGEMVAL